MALSDAILLDTTDNVVTCTRAVAAGEIISFSGAERGTLEVSEDIPIWHKAAREALPAGAQVRKYGESIGRLTAQVEKGGWISERNLVSEPRDYASEYLDPARARRKDL